MEDKYLIIETKNFYPVPVGTILKYEGHCKKKENGAYDVRIKILDIPSKIYLE